MSTTFTFEQLIQAAKECSRGVKWKDSIANWVHPRNMAINCKKLLDELENGTYHLSGYATFKIYEPKLRTIRSPKFRDRVVQRAMCNNGLYHDLTKGNIYDNGACQLGKGTKFAMDRLNCHLQRYWRKHGNEGWVLKADIHKFFDSIPHDKLKEMAEKLITNREHLRLVNEIIDSFSNPGIGLGSQISQLLAIAFLSPVDHYFKEKFKIRCYIRYSDDIVMIHDDKNVIINAFNELNEKLHGLSLEINPKSCISRLSDGISFLKFKFVLNKSGSVTRLLNHKSETRIRRRLKKLVKKLRYNKERKMTNEDVRNCFNSWKAHAELGNSYSKIMKMKKILQENDNGRDYSEQTEY